MELSGRHIHSALGPERVQVMKSEWLLLLIALGPAVSALPTWIHREFGAAGKRLRTEICSEENRL
jgi:hypothetical protein